MGFQCFTNVPSFAFKPTLSDCNLKNQTLTRRFKTANFRKKVWISIRKIVPRIYILYFRWAQGAFTRHPNSSLKMYRSENKWQKSTHIGNYCWRYPLKGIVKKVFGKWARKTSGKWRNYRFWFVTCSKNTQKQTSIIWSLEKVAILMKVIFSSQQMTYI